MKTIKVNSLREIDKLVAEHITNFYNKSLLGDGEPPYYSSSISAAWSVLNHFYYIDIEKFYNGKEYSCYVTNPDTINNCEIDGSATATTVELAICLAALETKGIKVKYEEV